MVGNFLRFSSGQSKSSMNDIEKNSTTTSNAYTTNSFLNSSNDGVTMLVSYKKMLQIENAPINSKIHFVLKLSIM